MKIPCMINVEGKASSTIRGGMMKPNAIPIIPMGV